jgi:hypothetical protein
MSLALFQVNAQSFDSIEYHGDGLALSSCSCSGKNVSYVPRSHIDSVSSGRSLFFKTFLLGLLLVIISAVVKARKGDGDTVLGLLVAGSVLMAMAVLGMIPRTLTIVSNNGNYVSTKCCNEVDFLADWLTQKSMRSQASPTSYANDTQGISISTSEAPRKR